MQESVPALGNRLATLLDRLVGQSSTTVAQAGDLGADPTGAGRAGHPHLQSEHFGALVRGLMIDVPGMAYGTFEGGAGAQTIAGLDFRPDWVFFLNIDTAALGVFSRSIAADNLMTFVLAAVYNAGLTGVTLADAGFTLAGAETIINNAGDTVHWVALGSGSAAVVAT